MNVENNKKSEKNQRNRNPTWLEIKSTSIVGNIQSSLTDCIIWNDKRLETKSTLVMVTMAMPNHMQWTNSKRFVHVHLNK